MSSSMLPSHPDTSNDTSDASAVPLNLPSSHWGEHGVESASTDPAAVGRPILRQDVDDVDPVHSVHERDSTEDETPAYDFPGITTSLPLRNSSRSAPFATPPVLQPLRLPKQLPAHRKNIKSTDIPHQTIMKALASAPLDGPAVTQLTLNPLRAALGEADDQGSNASTSPCLTATLGGRQTAPMRGLWSPASANLLRSPCFFHQRFDGLVDFQKIFEEVSEADYSHSRLMQTATGVREVSKQLQRRPLKRAVRTVMIVTKARDNNLVYLTRELAEWLLSTPRYGSDLGVTVYVDAKLEQSKRFNAASLVQKEPRFQSMLRYWTPDLCWSSPEKFDLVLTLGGDGTVLFTSWLFQRVVPPILSFSLGSLGFLTTFEFDKYKEHLDRAMGDAGMRVNLRMRFTCTVWHADTSPGAEKGAAEEGEQFEVLNELVIDRGPSAYVSNLELYVPSKSRSSAYCSFDGKGRIELKKGDYVTLEASQYPFPTVMTGTNEWVESVQRALRWNVRGAVQKGWDDGLDGEGQDQESEWDIDIDTPVDTYTGCGGTDSGIGPSEDGDHAESNITGGGVAASGLKGRESPMRRQMSLLYT
ncbi:hypothetical protein DV737_g4148, partial [Chaetothyriales sp. CBS 132003]